MSPRRIASHRFSPTTPDKRIIAAPTQGSPTLKPAFLSGSGGLLSTTEDYFRFAQMVLNGGEANGKRFLKTSTVELMRTNVLAKGVTVDGDLPGQPGIGFGLDFAIVMDPVAAETPAGKNTFYWGGAFGTWFWLDPTNDVVVVGMIQNVSGSSPTGGSPQVRPLSRQLVYQAFVDPKKSGLNGRGDHDTCGALSTGILALLFTAACRSTGPSASQAAALDQPNTRYVPD